MKSITIDVKAVIDTSGLPFVISEKLQDFFQSHLTSVGDNESYNCQILLPDPIKNGSLLSFVIYEPLKFYGWIIKWIDIYKVVEQGQSTVYLGSIDDGGGFFSETLNLEELADLWQSAILNDIAKNGISDPCDFNAHHLALVRSSNHFSISDLEDQLPEIGYKERLQPSNSRLR